MQKTILFISVLAIIVITAILLVWRMPKGEDLLTTNSISEATSSVLPTREPVVYKNTKYNFELSFPFNLNFKESSPEAIFIGNINDLQTESLVEVRVLTTPISSGQKISPTTAEQFIFDTAKKLCNASGPNITISCDKVEQLESITTLSGQIARTFYLSEKTTDNKSGEIKSTSLKGPFFSFDLTKNTPSSQSAILLSPPVQKDSQSVNGTLIRDVADSLKIVPLVLPSSTPSASPRKR